MKSTKYKKFYMSKNKFPTRVVQGGTSKGGLTIGHVKAKREIESRLKRNLKPGTKIRTAGSNWVFLEPKGPAQIPA